MDTAIIFDIQRNSFVDGPGIRTTVFFKGCNLKCKWCHNPESQSSKPQILFYKDKCTGCGRCAVASGAVGIGFLDGAAGALTCRGCLSRRGFCTADAGFGAGMVCVMGKG